MIRAVIDTNVLISALIAEHGAEAAVLDDVASGQLVWCVSMPIIDEYQRVLSRPKFSFFDPIRLERLRILLTTATVVTPSGIINASPDEPDNRFLECAEAAGAKYLITGNKRHFPRSWKTTEVLTAREFLNSRKG